MGVKVKKWKGAWWVFTNHKKKRNAKRIGTREQGKRQAEVEAAVVRAFLATGGELGPPQVAVPPAKDEPPTLRAYATAWLANYAAVECKPRTHELYDSMLHLHVFPTVVKTINGRDTLTQPLGDMPLPSMRRSHIQELLAIKAKSRPMGKGAADGEDPPTLKKSTIRNILAPLRQLLTHAVEEKLIESNPASNVGRKLSKLTANQRRAEVEIFTEPELAMLIARTEASYADYLDLIRTAVLTGLRQGELLGLQWDDIDFYGEFIDVRRTVAYRKGKFHVGPPKSGKSRRVDAEALMTALRSRYEKAKEDAALNELAFVPWVFPNRSGHAQDASHITSRLWHPLLREAGLRKVKFHTLRHTYASHLLMKGESLVYVKEQLGHSSINVTVDLYGHLLPKSHKGAIQSLAKAISATRNATDGSQLDTLEEESAVTC